MRYHLTPVRLGIIRKSTNNKCWRGCGETGTLLHFLWECKLVHPLRRTVWRFLRKLKIELPYDPAIPLLGIYPEKTIIQKDTCTPMFIAALFTIAKTWKRPKCILILNPTTLLNFFYYANSFLVESLWFSIYNIVSSTVGSGQDGREGTP